MTACVESMAYSGQTPWHGLGTRVSNDLSVDEMLEAAGLNWKVRKVPTFYEVREIGTTNFAGFRMNKNRRYKTGKQALIRDTDNSILSLVSDNWNPCQNDEAFEIFAEFVERNELEMHTAGSLKGGKIVWGLAK